MFSVCHLRPMTPQERGLSWYLREDEHDKKEHKSLVKNPWGGNSLDEWNWVKESKYSRQTDGKLSLTDRWIQTVEYAAITSQTAATSSSEAPVRLSSRCINEDSISAKLTSCSVSVVLNVVLPCSLICCSSCVSCSWASSTDVGMYSWLAVLAVTRSSYSLSCGCWSLWTDDRCLMQVSWNGLTSTVSWHGLQISY